MSAIEAQLPPRFDVFDPGLLDDPYPIYARLRHAGGVCRAGPGAWAVLRYRDVAELLHDPSLLNGFRSGIRRPRLVAGGPPGDELLPPVGPTDELRRIVSGLDPPDHTRVRALVQKAMSAAAGRGFRERVRLVVDRLLDEALEAGTLDVVTELALPAQTSLMCDLLGVPEPDRPEVVARSTTLGRAIILTPFAAVEPGGGAGGASWLRGYMDGLLEVRADRENVVSALREVADDGARLTRAEIVDNAVFLLFAGLETTVHVVAAGCAALVRFPDQLARLRAERGLVPSAVEEVLRYDAPLQWITRVAARPIEIGGRRIRARRLLLLVVGSANRDEAAFSDANRFDVTRRPNPHLSFGAGPHHCIGVFVARAVGAVVLERLLARCAGLEAIAPPVARPHPNVRGYASVRLAVHPA